MSQFFGILAREYKMAVKRPGMWIAYLVLYIFYGFTVLAPDKNTGQSFVVDKELWQSAGFTMFYLNMFMVLLGGVLSADRMQRDFRLGIRELQQSAPVKNSTYLLAKYFGVLAGVISPLFLYILIIAIIAVIKGAPTAFIGIMFVVCAAMGLPAYAFVVAFSLVCPLFMPVRVYQVLFVGYWFWGNYLNAGVFPTISDTLLVPNGKYVLYGFFGGFPSTFQNFQMDPITTLKAILNLALLFFIIMLVLIFTNVFFNRKSRTV